MKECVHSRNNYRGSLYFDMENHCTCTICGGNNNYSFAIKFKRSNGSIESTNYSKKKCIKLIIQCTQLNMYNIPQKMIKHYFKF